MNRFFCLTSLLFVGGLNGLASPEAGSAPDTSIQVTAALVTPLDIVVKWKDPAPGAAGYIVEWTTNPANDDYTILDFLPPDQTSFKHPNLMPETACYYRVRAIYGPASPEVEVSLPKELSDAVYAERFAKPEDYNWAGPVTIPDQTPVAKKSIRNASTAADAGPANFKITLMPVTVSGFKLTWTDRASDEEGFMIEIKPEGSSGFKVCALVKPDINSFGWAFSPPVRKATLRVRAYYYGTSSNVVHLLTGPEQPAQKSPETKPESPSKSGK